MVGTLLAEVQKIKRIKIIKGNYKWH